MYENFTINAVNSTTFTLTHNSSNYTDTVYNVETFEFSDVTYTAAELAGLNSLDNIQFKYAGNNGESFSRKYYNDTSGEQSVLASDLGYSGSTEYFSINRASNSDITVTNGSSGPVIFGSILDRSVLTNLTLDGFENVSVYALNAVGATTTVANGQTGYILAGAGGDTINVDANYTNNALATLMTIKADRGNDFINYNGDDIALSARIEAGNGNDTVAISGVANTLTYLGYGDDAFTGGDGIDTAYGQLGTNTISGGAGNDTLVGGTGVDTIRGGDDDDLINGNIGSDFLYGDAGNDKLYGHDGNDRAEGGEGNDLIYGDAGTDTLYGDAGNDTLYGGADDDTLYGGDGADRLIGDAGNDTLYGDGDADSLYGGDGQDRLEGGDGNDYLYGDAGNDILFGGAGADRLLGGAGNDTLVGNGTRDLLYGQGGADVFSMESYTNTYDRWVDFRLSDGDTINLSDMLTGFDQGVDDISDFVVVTDRGSHHRLYIDADGAGGYIMAAQIFDANTLNGHSAQDLLDNGQLVVNSEII